MYVLTIEEIFENLNEIINSLEVSNESAYGIVIEIAHQMKDELASVCTD
jgi:hypothetical protein